MNTPLLRLQCITKRYPTVVANEAVSLEVQPGQIHAVLGENGAGKSTLMKIIYGLVRPDAGQLFFQGQEIFLNHPRQARALGIAMVFQHFSLFDSLTVAQNVWLGLDSTLSLPELSLQIVETATRYGLDLDPQRPVHTLSVGEKQRVEIIRALLSNPRLLILDEPTSVLTPQAVDKLFDVLRQLSAQGCSILYISHKLHEIRTLCHHCTVMRSGHVVQRCDPRQESLASLSQMMMGRDVPPLAVSPRTPGPVVLQVDQLSLDSEDVFGISLRDICLEVRQGEVVGIAGVSGNGQRELMAALSGEDARAPAHSIRLQGQDVGTALPGRRRQLGMHFVPEERLGRGSVPEHSLAHNLLLTRDVGVQRGGWLNLGVLRQQATHLIERFQVKASGPMALAKSLSGGNLQKFIVGREMDARPTLLMLAQPTWGVDVGAAAQIHASLIALRDAGCAILLVSEELEELLELSDRLHVMAQGRLSPSLSRHEASTDIIGTWMSGLWPSANATPSPC
jgi:ABC-type uncharacterized transport system ATPase subunit